MKAIIAIIVLIAAIGGIFLYASSVQREGNDLEQTLSADYQGSQLQLDTYTKTIKESVSIANLQMDKLTELIREGVSGRYQGQNSQGASVFVSAIKESYPQLPDTFYKDIAQKVAAGREAFLQTQKGFRDRIRVYEKWRTDGLIRPHFISFMGFPSNNLEARIGTATVLHGQAALDQMKVLVTSSGTTKSFQTGEEEPMDFSTPKK